VARSGTGSAPVLCDRTDRCPAQMFQAGLVIFAAGSLTCCVAPDLSPLGVPDVRRPGLRPLVVGVGKPRTT
jgi:hypothetical protein